MAERERFSAFFGKTFAEKSGQQFLQREIAQFAAGQKQHRGKGIRQRNHTEELAAFIFDPRAHVKKVVLQVRKWMMGVDNLGRDDGRNRIFKILGAVFLFRRFQLFVSETIDAMHPQLLFQSGADSFPLLVQRTNRPVNGFQLLLGRPAGAMIVGIRLDMHQVKDAAHPDHEKFVKIARKNRGKFEPFQKRHRFISGLGKNTVVKREPGELAVLHESAVSQCGFPLSRA